MGFFGKLFGAGAAAGVGVAATKVAEQVKKNNPEGVGDLNQDGKVDYADYLVAVQQAAKDLYGESAPKVKEAAQKKIDEVKGEHPEAAAKIEDILGQAKGLYEENAPKVKAAASKAKGVVDKVVDDVTNK